MTGHWARAAATLRVERPRLARARPAGVSLRAPRGFCEDRREGSALPMANGMANELRGRRAVACAGWRAAAGLAAGIRRQEQLRQRRAGDLRHALRSGVHRVLDSVPGDPSPCAWGVERRAEISGLGHLAGCFLGLGSGLGLVGTVSSRR